MQHVLEHAYEYLRRMLHFDREGISQALCEWIDRRTEPETMLAVRLARRLKVIEVKPTGADWITPLHAAKSAEEAAEVFLVRFEGAKTTKETENNKIKFYKPFIDRYYQETDQRREYTKKY